MENRPQRVSTPLLAWVAHHLDVQRGRSVVSVNLVTAGWTPHQQCVMGSNMLLDWMCYNNEDVRCEQYEKGCPCDGCRDDLRATSKVGLVACCHSTDVELDAHLTLRELRVASYTSGIPSDWWWWGWAAMCDTCRVIVCDVFPGRVGPWPTIARLASTNWTVPDDLVATACLRDPLLRSCWRCPSCQ